MSYISVLEKLNYGTMGLIELAIQRWLEKGDDIALDEAEGESREVIEELRALSAMHYLRKIVLLPRPFLTLSPGRQKWFSKKLIKLIMKRLKLIFKRSIKLPRD